MTRLVDNYARTIRQLRVSVTGDCNLGCIYCHNEGNPYEGRWLTADEIGRISAVGHRLGINKFRVTGGEPLLREDLAEILRALPAGTEKTMTTNGIGLEKVIGDLVGAGLERINVSLDSLDHDTFRYLTRGDVDRVLDGVHAALESNISQVKLNTVVTPRNIDHIPALLDFAQSHERLHLQLIEIIRFRGRLKKLWVDLAQVEEMVGQRCDRRTTREAHNRPIFWFGDTRVEVLRPEENPSFCAGCTRLRLTADGFLRGCLHETGGRSLRLQSEAEIEESFLRVVDDRVPRYIESRKRLPLVSSDQTMPPPPTC